MLISIKQYIWVHRYMLAVFFLCLALGAGALFRSEILSGAIAVSYTVGNKEIPICSVATDEKKIALSFDAAWGNGDTDELLSILAKHNVHATFFMTGGWVESYPEDVKAIAAAGHDLGNHSENHKEMSKLTGSEIESELMSVHNKVKELTGKEMFLFRPPYGDYDNDVIKTAASLNYYTIQWSVDSLDWKNYGIDSIIKMVCEHKDLGNGAIILCHNGAKYTAKALDTLLTYLQDAGFEIVPVSELIYKDNFHIDYTGKQIAD